MNDNKKDIIDNNSIENSIGNTNTENDNNSSDKINSNDNNPKKRNILIGIGILISLGLGTASYNYFTNNTTSEEFEDFRINDDVKVALDFSIEDNGKTRDRTAQEMREFYTPQGEEFIKTIYPDSSDSDLALLTVGKSISNELSKLEFTTLDNKKIKLKKLKGKKIILDFALSTCPSCQEEFTFLDTKELNDDEVLLHIFPVNSQDEIKQIYTDLKLNLKENITVESSGLHNLTIDDLKITHVPTKIYINEEGIVTYVTTQTLSDEENYKLHYDRAFGNGEKILDYLKTK